MKPHIDKTGFGSITVSGKLYEHDIIIRLNGKVKKRKKKLSKEKYGTSHKISFKEAEYIFEKGAEQLIIGTGQNGYVELSDEANRFFLENKCHVKQFPTPQAIKEWNETKDSAVIGMFHITC
jgi:hypothetical protein